MRNKIEPILEGSKYEKTPANMLDAGKFFEKFDNVESLLRETIDRSRMNFTVEDIKKCIELVCNRFQIQFVSIDNKGILTFRNNETTCELYISLLCYREESVKAIKEIIHKIEHVNDVSGKSENMKNVGEETNK